MRDISAGDTFFNSVFSLASSLCCRLSLHRRHFALRSWAVPLRSGSLGMHTANWTNSDETVRRAESRSSQANDRQRKVRFCIVSAGKLSRSGEPRLARVVDIPWYLGPYLAAILSAQRPRLEQVATSVPEAWGAFHDGNQTQRAGRCWRSCPGRVAAFAQQVTGELGSPGATTTINGKQIPPPPPGIRWDDRGESFGVEALVGPAGRAAEGRTQRVAYHDR
jgi:hypothetical protein